MAYELTNDCKQLLHYDLRKDQKTWQLQGGQFIYHQNYKRHGNKGSLLLLVEKCLQIPITLWSKDQCPSRAIARRLIILHCQNSSSKCIDIMGHGVWNYLKAGILETQYPNVNATVWNAKTGRTNLRPSEDRIWLLFIARGLPIQIEVHIIATNGITGWITFTTGFAYVFSTRPRVTGTRTT